MKIKGQHGEFGFTQNGEPIPMRQIEVEEGEKVRVTLVKTGPGLTHVGGEEIISYFMPGVLTLVWSQNAKLEREGGNG